MGLLSYILMSFKALITMRHFKSKTFVTFSQIREKKSRTGMMKYAELNHSIQGEFDNIATKLKVKSIKWVSLFC